MFIANNSITQFDYIKRLAREIYTALKKKNKLLLTSTVSYVSTILCMAFLRAKLVMLLGYPAAEPGYDPNSPS